MDLEAIEREWLRQCGICDAGLPTACTCPPGDPRAVIQRLVEEMRSVEVERNKLMERVAKAFSTTPEQMAKVCGVRYTGAPQ